MPILTRKAQILEVGQDLVHGALHVVHAVAEVLVLVEHVIHLILQDSHFGGDSHHLGHGAPLLLAVFVHLGLDMVP